MKFVSVGPNDGPMFDKYVKRHPAFVKFYSPHCYHCNEMAPAWQALEEPTKNGTQNRVNIIEVHNDAIGDIQSPCVRNIMGFPTLMEVKPGGQPGREFHGPRDTKSMLKFIRTTFPLKKKTTTKKKTKKTKNKNNKNNTNNKKSQRKAATQRAITRRRGQKNKKVRRQK